MYHNSFTNLWQVSLNVIRTILFPLWIFNFKYLHLKLFTCCFNYVVHFKTKCFPDMKLFLAHSCGYAMNKHWHRGPVVKTLALKSDGWGSNFAPVKSLFSFFFFLFFSFIYTFILTFLVSWAYPLHKIQIFFAVFCLQFADKLIIVLEVWELTELHHPSSSPFLCLVSCLRVMLQC